MAVSVFCLALRKSSAIYLASMGQNMNHVVFLFSIFIQKLFINLFFIKIYIYTHTHIKGYIYYKFETHSTNNE